MDEFELISHFFSPLSIEGQDLLTGIGDDAAIVDVQSVSQLAISNDTFVENVHFLPSWPAEAIAYRSLSASLSDLAAMGAVPLWVTMSLTMPEPNTTWLQGFTLGLEKLVTRYDVRLIGGDTTKGPLTISFTVLGKLDKGRALRRSGAVVGSYVYVTGRLGEPAYALTQLAGKSIDDAIFRKLLYPKPKIEHGLILSRYANAAIDISDGLSSDLAHILNASHVGCRLTENDIPISKLLLEHLPVEKARDYALNGGDEYELCFTVDSDKKADCERALNEAGLSYYRIGMITESLDFVLVDSDGQTEGINPAGFRHF